VSRRSPRAREAARPRAGKTHTLIGGAVGAADATHDASAAMMARNFIRGRRERWAASKKFEGKT